ncbi:alpha-E domain-containing protein [Parasynechococcus sp.]|uniref:alpha-E domain-containing protein n=1 Tax=Parasynechococcus sp. TaxID=3101203 RepID=UPI003703E888
MTGDHYRFNTAYPDATPKQVVRFLLLDPIFLRSVRYCLQGISDTLQQIQQHPSHDTPDDRDCLRGQLLARWSYVRIDNLIEAGLHEAIDQLQQDLNQLHSLIQTRYFTSADLRSTPPIPHARSHRSPPDVSV